jgi:hypothetical protein
MCGQIGETRLATWLDPMLAVVAADQAMTMRQGCTPNAAGHARRIWTARADVWAFLGRPAAMQRATSPMRCVVRTVRSAGAGNRKRIVA